MRINIPTIEEPMSLEDFYHDYMSPNLPCLFDCWITKDWPARHGWCTSTGEIDISMVFKPFDGESKVCVSDCSRLEFGTHPTLDITLSEFLIYWKASHAGQDDRLLYLKDWHYFRLTNESFYTIPELFASDWMDEFWRVRPDLMDDFKFVYLGREATWTPLHADVYRSFSWSANICGHKRWWFFPPGEEVKLEKLNKGSMPTDVRQLDLDSAAISYCILEQQPGQAVFVPSGWYHQVLNVTDCLSLNHNWFNATNLSWVWDHLQSQLNAVERSTEDVRDTPGWREECQICLRALCGMDFTEFSILLKHILVTRWPGRNTPSLLPSILSGGGEGGRDALNEWNKHLDLELLQLVASERDAWRIALMEANSWSKLLNQSKSSLASRSTTNVLPKWLQLHNFQSAAECLGRFNQNAIVGELGLSITSLDLGGDFIQRCTFVTRV